MAEHGELCDSLEGKYVQNVESDDGSGQGFQRCRHLVRPAQDGEDLDSLSGYAGDVNDPHRPSTPIPPWPAIV